MSPIARRAADVAVGALIVGLMLAGAALSGDEPARPFDAVLVVAVVIIGVWTVVARSAPRTALVGAGVCYYAAQAVDVPAFTPALALGVPLLFAARAGHLRWAVATVALVSVGGVGFRLLDEPVGAVLFDTLRDVSLMALLVLLGDTLRSRRAAREEATLRVRLAEAQHQRRLVDERLRVARDLHDVLAHTLTVVGVQAGVAAESLDDDDGDSARTAVGHVRASVRDAMADLRGTIALLRSDPGHDDASPVPHPAPTLTELPALLDGVRRAGLDATLTVHGDPAALRAAVDVTGYRVVQEALTNVLRHARARSVAVRVCHAADAVTLEVRDDGTGRVGPEGAGLRGMSERVAAVGGSVCATPADDGRPGFAVRARLPAGGAP